MRAGTLFYARIGLLALVLLVLVVPSWSKMLGVTLLPGLAWYVFAVSTRSRVSSSRTGGRPAGGSRFATLNSIS